jgi:RHS repeat-associated protein
MLRSATTSYYAQDGLNSVTSLSNAAGALAQTYTFDSFGKQTASSGSLTNSFQYTGRELDSETGLYFFKARYYDSSAGRFLNEDPLGLESGSSNFYSYVENSPTTWIDPSGLCRGWCLVRIVDKRFEQFVWRQQFIQSWFVAQDWWELQPWGPIKANSGPYAPDSM